MDEEGVDSAELWLRIWIEEVEDVRFCVFISDQEWRTKVASR